MVDFCIMFGNQVHMNDKDHIFHFISFLARRFGSITATFLGDLSLDLDEGKT